MQSGLRAISASASLVVARPMGSPLASAPASLPTFSSECTQTPTRSRLGRSWMARIAIEPMPPVDHTTTRYLGSVILFPPGSVKVSPVERPWLSGALQVAEGVVHLDGREQHGTHQHRGRDHGQPCGGDSIRAAQRRKVVRELRYHRRAAAVVAYTQQRDNREQHAVVDHHQHRELPACDMQHGTGGLGVDEQSHLQPHELHERVQWKPRNESGEKDRNESMPVQRAVLADAWLDETTMDRDQT